MTLNVFDYFLELGVDVKWPKENDLDEVSYNNMKEYCQRGCFPLPIRGQKDNKPRPSSLRKMCDQTLIRTSYTKL